MCRNMNQNPTERVAIASSAAWSREQRASSFSQLFVGHGSEDGILPGFGGAHLLT
jgi:hypothetical protein